MPQKSALSKPVPRIVWMPIVLVLLVIVAVYVDLLAAVGILIVVALFDLFNAVMRHLNKTGRK